MFTLISGTPAFVARQREALDQVFLALALGGSVLLAIAQITVLLALSLWRGWQNQKLKEFEHRERHK